ncbi:retinitis pigmentosa 1-like 1 protein isoform X2 [Trichomycterus rosablanca]|uniref:retinitis pigmentosa 1-like 1 protein isoform X2 n=1 Tax=Trichomycterus rosablanca TaxID=2290929 RepID=UPI002F3525E3
MNCLRSWWSRLRRRSSDRSDPATPENQTEINEPKKRKKMWSMKKLRRIFRKKRKEEGEGKLQEEVKEGEDPQRSGDNGDVVELLVVPEESSWENSDAGGLEISDHVGDDKKMISQHQGEAVKVMTCSKAEAEYKDDEGLMDVLNRTSESISWCDGENQMLDEMNEAGAEALNELMKLHLGTNEEDEAGALEEQMKTDMDVDGTQENTVELLELRESEAESEALAELTNTNVSENVKDPQAEPEAIEEQMKADLYWIEENTVELLELRESEAESEAKSEAENEAITELTNMSENEKDSQAEPEALEVPIHTDMDKQETGTEDLQTFNNIEFEGRTEFTQTLMEREISGDKIQGNQTGDVMDVEHEVEASKEINNTVLEEAEDHHEHLHANQTLEVIEGEAGGDFTHVLKNESENADERVQGEKNIPGNNTVDPTKQNKKKIRRGTRGRGRKINYKKEKKQGSEITTMVEAEAEATVEIMNIRSDETDSHDEPLGNQVMKEKDGEEETETITQITKCQLEELMLRSEGQPLDVKVEESMVKVEDAKTDSEALEDLDGIEVINNQPLEEKEMLNMSDLEVEVAEMSKNVHQHEPEANINQPPAGNEVPNLMDAQARAELKELEQLLKIEVETRDEAPVEAAEEQKLRCFEEPRMINLVPPAGNEVLNVMDAQVRAEDSNQQMENKRLDMKIKQLLKIEVETRAEAPVEAAEEQKLRCFEAPRMMNLVPQPIQRKKIRRGTRGKGRKINYKKENKQETSAGGPEDQTKTSEATCWRAGHAGTELLRNSRTAVKYPTGLEEIKSW